MMTKVAVYIHGKGGSAAEAGYYKKFFGEKYDVVGFDYKSELLWDAKDEFQKYFVDIFARYDEVVLIANSIGAYFSFLSLSKFNIKKAMFISPIVDMEKLILDKMKEVGISEENLCLRKIMHTQSGETLSWDYLAYVRNNPITWNIPSSILYGKKDNMTGVTTITDFSNMINASLTMMENGEHWFHTEEQMLFLDTWFAKFI